MRISIVIDFLWPTFAPDATDILCKLSVERNGKCEKEYFKIGYVRSFAKNLTSRDQYPKSSALDLLKSKRTLSEG